MKVLVTGGAGYIGSTTAQALEESGHTAVILDSLVTGPRAFVGERAFYHGDIGDRSIIRRIFKDHPDIECTIHMAARIIVPESVEHPGLYYRENVVKSLDLFEELAAIGMPNIVFSSSASIYARPSEGFEVTEDSPVAPGSPYAWTKLIMERVLTDLASSGSLRTIILRYFNPIGAAPNLRTGVHVREPSHVLGQLVMAAQGRKDAFAITGTDLPTRDGTGIRDYISVWDLARAHVAAVERFDTVLAAVRGRSAVMNVGTGQGVTVRELVAAFESVWGREIPIVDTPPRPGDSVGAYANVDRAAQLLGWRANVPLHEAIQSALAWDTKRRAILGYD